MALTIRLEQHEETQLENLKEFIGCATATAAIKRAAFSYIELNQRIEQQNAKIRDLNFELSRIKRLGADYMSAREAFLAELK